MKKFDSFFEILIFLIILFIVFNVTTTVTGKIKYDNSIKELSEKIKNAEIEVKKLSKIKEENSKKSDVYSSYSRGVSVANYQNSVNISDGKLSPSFESDIRNVYLAIKSYDPVDYRLWSVKTNRGNFEWSYETSYSFTGENNSIWFCRSNDNLLAYTMADYDVNKKCFSNFRVFYTEEGFKYSDPNELNDINNNIGLAITEGGLIEKVADKIEESE